MNLSLRVDLLQLIGEQRLSQFAWMVDTEFVSEKIETDDLLRLALYLEGGRIADSPRLLRRLIQSLPDEEQRSMADAILGRSHTKPLDNAIALSRASGTSRSDVVAAVAKALALEDYFPVTRGSNRFVGHVQHAATDAKSLLEHQIRVVEKCRPLLRDLKSFLIQMPTGSGKTLTALSALILSGVLNRAIRDDATVLWLAPSVELLRQAATSFASLWARDGSGPIRIVMGDEFRMGPDIPGAAIAFLTYQKLTGLLSPDNLEQRGMGFRVLAVVADEAHRALAATYGEAIQRVRGAGSVPLIGLTATPGRVAELDAQNSRLSSFFGGTMIRAYDDRDEIQELRARGILSEVQFKVLHSGLLANELPNDEADSDTEDLFTTDGPTMASLARSPERNQLIVRTLVDAADGGHRSIVFACSVEHALVLEIALRLRGLAAVTISANTPDAYRESRIADFRKGQIKVLINFGVFTAGFDAPGTDFVLIARPTTSLVSFSQMVGRALRGPKMGGAAHSTVVHVQDGLSSPEYVNRMYTHFDGYWQRAI